MSANDPKATFRVLECLCQHPNAACEKARSGKPRNYAAYRNHFFDQHEYRHRDDPKHIHHAAYEQYSHQDPATAYAISAVTGTQGERAVRVRAKPAVVLNELQWRPALPQAGVLERRPLIKTGCNQNQAAKDPARNCHFRRKQAPPFQCPLRECRNKSKADPGEKIAAGKPGARREWLSL